MELIIREMTLENFKGIKSQTVEFGRRATDIGGANGTGKSTIADAFTWLLFGKDASGDKEFPVKPRACDGREIHGLTTSVSALFEHDGKTLTLKRTMSEKWSRPRGQAEAVYGGNTESFEVNGAECKMGEYKQFVDSLVKEDVFKTVTDPNAFNSMDWRKKREALIGMSGIDLDGAMLTDGKYTDIARTVIDSGLTIEQYRKRVMGERKAANAAVDLLPARIDEASRQITGGDVEKLETAYHDALQTSRAARDNYAVMRDNNGMDALKRRAAEAQTEFDEYARRAERAHRAEYDAVCESIRREARKADEVKHDIADAEKRAAEAREEIEEKRGYIVGLEDEIAKMRDEWRTVHDSVFGGIDTSETICPTCGREYDAERIEQLNEQARAAFDAKRAERMKALSESGKESNALIAKYRAKMTELTEKINKLDTVVADLKAQDVARERVIPSYSPFDGQDDKEYIRLREAAQRANKAASDNDTDEETARAAQTVKETDEALTRAYDAYMAAKRSADAETRVAELMQEQQSLGAQIADAEMRLALIEDYAKARAERLSNAVNGLFPTVRWKLTSENINGGVEECCECLVVNAESGALVPWDKANSAAKINAGLEIINAICDKRGIEVPVFIDNAESVNRLEPTLGQQIRLYVTDSRALTIERRDE